MMNFEFNLDDAKKVWKNDGIIVGRMEEKPITKTLLLLHNLNVR